MRPVYKKTWMDMWTCINRLRVRNYGDHQKELWLYISPLPLFQKKCITTWYPVTKWGMAKNSANIIKITNIVWYSQMRAIRSHGPVYAICQRWGTFKDADLFHFNFSLMKWGTHFSLMKWGTHYEFQMSYTTNFKFSCKRWRGKLRTLKIPILW